QDIAEPSTRTRSQTSKTSSDTKEKTRIRQQEYRASLKKMDIECKHCGVLRLKREKPELCCMNGEVILAPLQAPPPEIYYLLIAKDPISKVLFVNKIRAYNQLSFTKTRRNAKIYFHDSSDIEAQIDRRHDIMKQSIIKQGYDKYYSKCINGFKSFCRYLYICRK
ncbi:5605_t:CDS:2, partial [Dentiscutata erythropus]